MFWVAVVDIAGCREPCLTFVGAGLREHAAFNMNRHNLYLKYILLVLLPDWPCHGKRLGFWQLFLFCFFFFNFPFFFVCEVGSLLNKDEKLLFREVTMMDKANISVQ